LAGDLARDADRETRAGERMALDKTVGQTSSAAERRAPRP